MNMTMPGRKSLASLPLLPLALLVSLLFSLLLALTNPLLNDDAFTYIKAAERFQQDGIDAVLQEYGWHAYSVLIALADAVVPGGLVASAQLLNALFHLLLTGAFLALQRESSASVRQQWLAGIVILLFPLLNEMRYFIIRDVAYWAFSLLALLQLPRLARATTIQQSLLLALAWCGSTLMAALFRLEALLPALLAPLTLLAGSATGQARLHNVHATLLLYGTLLLCAALLLLIALVAGINLPELMSFAWRYYLPLLSDLAGMLKQDALAVTAALFTPQNFPGSDNLGMGLLLLGFSCLAAVLLNLAGALGVPFTLLLLLGWRQDLQRLPRAVALPWLGYAAPSLLALLLFQLIMHFQTQRYAALLCLLLLLYLPGFIDQWWQRAERQGKTGRFRQLLAFFILGYSVDSLVSFGYSRQHLALAEQWVQEELPTHATLATNSFQLAWRSGRVPDYDRTQREPILAMQAAPDSDYVVMELKRDDAASRALLDADSALSLVTSFSNERGDEVRIYRRSAR
ncbi:MAG: hypothetical protein ACO3PV_06795 [Pseudohongiellaceae bacterium]